MNLKPDESKDLPTIFTKISTNSFSLISGEKHLKLYLLIFMLIVSNEKFIVLFKSPNETPSSLLVFNVYVLHYNADLISEFKGKSVITESSFKLINDDFLYSAKLNIGQKCT